MATTKTGPSASGASDALGDLLENQLPKLWRGQAVAGAPKFFQSGIEFIAVSVKTGLVEVSLTLAGKDSPGTLLYPGYPGKLQGRSPGIDS